jgi:hypothetical protein
MHVTAVMAADVMLQVAIPAVYPVIPVVAPAVGKTHGIHDVVAA